MINFTFGTFAALAIILIISLLLVGFLFLQLFREQTIEKQISNGVS